MTNSHPLNPLTAGEIRQAAAILRRDRGVGGTWRFASIELKEPAKATLPALGADQQAGLPASREAIVVCWDRTDGQAHRATVSLTGDEVTSWEHLPGQQPNMTVDEWHECDEMLRAHPALVQALARRGITDISLVLTDMWAYGAALVPERYQGLRLGWCDVWYRSSEQSNPYAHHVTGLHPVVDLNTMTLLELEDSYQGGNLPNVMGEYLPRLIPTPLREVTPLQISQPAGVGFTLDGHLLSWQDWQLRLGFNHREGLVLHQVAFRDGERWRPVAHRLSFAEMVVPYRDASPDHYRRTAFDIGEWGLGFMTTSLSLGCDCLGEIAYLDAVVHDSRGEPRTIPNAICVHEEDSGVLWKHVDERAGVEVRRARRLVISFHVTVANYEYLVYWRFYQDGNIECEVRATGILVTSHTDAPGSPASQRDAGRRAHLRAVPPALHRRPAGSRRGRARQYRLRHRVRGGRGGRCRRPVRAGAGGQEHPAAHRGGGETGLRLGHPARLEGGERPCAERSWYPRRLQARALGRVPAPARPRLARIPTSPGDRPHALGDPLPRGRALALRRLPEPERARFGPARLDRGEPAHRGYRRGALVRVRHPPHHPAGGLAGDAERHRLRSGSSRSGSSTATRPWTCPRATRTCNASRPVRTNHHPPGTGSPSPRAVISAKLSRRQASRTSGSGTAAVSMLMPISQPPL